MANQADAIWARPPLDVCDPGDLHPALIEDALRRTNLYRWLVGLAPVTVDAQYSDDAQQCAMVLAADGNGPTHEISPKAMCYTDAAARGARNSNLSFGWSNPSDAVVDGFIRDSRVPTLGHRRLLFRPQLGEVGFGQRDLYSCMYVVDSRGTGTRPRFVAFPPPGFLPTTAMVGSWSFSSELIQLGADTVVSVRTTGTPALQLDVRNTRFLPGQFKAPAMSWDVVGWTSGVPYQVTLENSLARLVSYTVEFVECDWTLPGEEAPAVRIKGSRRKGGKDA